MLTARCDSITWPRLNWNLESVPSTRSAIVLYIEATTRRELNAVPDAFRNARPAVYWTFHHTSIQFTPGTNRARRTNTARVANPTIRPRANRAHAVFAIDPSAYSSIFLAVSHKPRSPSGGTAAHRRNEFARYIAPAVVSVEKLNRSKYCLYRNSESPNKATNSKGPSCSNKSFIPEIHIDHEPEDTWDSRRIG